LIDRGVVMMNLSPFQVYLRTMLVGPGRVSRLSKEEAYTRLKNLAGVDFGFDIQAWREWGKQNPDISGTRPIESSDDSPPIDDG
jgi:hypothetical protein